MSVYRCVSEDRKCWAETRRAFRPLDVESGSETAAWAGGTHEAGSETFSFGLSWFWPAECEDIRVDRISSRVVWWVGKRKTREAEGRLLCEEVEVSSKEKHVPDYSSRRKDISLFASIVPPFAETLKYCRSPGRNFPRGLL